jgi:serine/threonine protein kinase
MRNLNHESIVKLYEVFESDNSIYLLMEFLEGGLLFKRLSQRKFLNEKEVKILLKKLVLAVK